MTPTENLPAVPENQVVGHGGYVPAVTNDNRRAEVRGVRIIGLRLRGVEIDYDIDFRNAKGGFRSLSIIAGAFSTGKSSVLEFVNYCLGARNHPQHPEILRKVRAAILEVQLNGQRFVIERAVGEPSTHAYVRPGQIGDKSDHRPERRPLHPAGDPNSLSSFLLSYCGLEGVELREAPSKEESATDPLSFRDLMWFCYLPNERLDDKNLLYESSPMRFLKLGQVFNVIFGCHDDKAVELGGRVKELESRLAKARQEASSAQTFVDEQEFGSRELLEAQHERAIAEIEQTDLGLVRLDREITAASNFAEELRTSQEAGARADRAAALVRDRETQLKRLMPLRAQYADDVSKLVMLSEADRLFDPLRVRVCPACLTQLDDLSQISEGECSLCHSTVSTNAPVTAVGVGASDPTDLDQVDAELNDVDVSAELRATRARLAEITQYIEQLDDELPQLRSQLTLAVEHEGQTAQALDRATHRAVSPFLSQRDDLVRTRERGIAEVERITTGIRLHESVDRRLLDVARLETSLHSVRAELQSSTPPVSRSTVISSISQRYVEILSSWKYPKLDQAFIHGDLRGSSGIRVHQ